MIDAGIDGDRHRLARRGQSPGEIDARLRRGPVVGPADEECQRCGHRVSVPRAQRFDASRVEGDTGAKIRRRTRAILPCGDGALTRVEGRQQRASAMRPAEQRDAVGRHLRARLQIRERTLRVEAARRHGDRPLPVLDRADLLATAGTEAVGKQHDITLAGQQLGHPLMPQRQRIAPRRQRAEHAAAAVQRDDRGIPAVARALRPEHEGGDSHRAARRRIEIERIERHPLRGEPPAGRAAARRGHDQGHRHDGRPSPTFHRHRRLPRAAACRKAPIACHAASFSANGRVYAGDDDGNASVA